MLLVDLIGAAVEAEVAAAGAAASIAPTTTTTNAQRKMFNRPRLNGPIH